MAASRFRAVMLGLALLLAAVPGPGTASAVDTASRGPVEQVEEILDLTQQIVDLTVKVGIPLVGGKIEDLVASLLTKAARAENKVGVKWLAGA